MEASSLNLRLGRRALAQITLACIACFAMSSARAAAQEMKEPKGPFEITVPSSAGSTPDVTMRRVAKILNEEGIVKQPVVVVNRVGGAWAVGTNYVLSRPRQTNTLIVVAEAIFTLPISQGTPTVYNRLTPLGTLIEAQLMIVAQPNHEADDLAELVKIAKAKPGQVKLSGSNAFSPDAMVAGLLESNAGIDITYIPHDGGGAALATFLGGNTDITILNIDEALPLIAAGKAKPMALLNETRRPEPRLKDFATAKEQGVNVVWSQYFGLAAAPEQDPAVVAWWDDKIAKLVQTKAWQSFLTENLLVDAYKNSKDTKPFLAEMHQVRLDMLRRLGRSKL
jgi:putative tricarboxylic transport membrane protein